jgi:hypothetical protein
VRVFWYSKQDNTVNRTNELQTWNGKKKKKKAGSLYTVARKKEKRKLVGYIQRGL